MSSTETPGLVPYERLNKRGFMVKMQGMRTDLEPHIVNLVGYEFDVPERSIITLRLRLCGASWDVKLNIASNELNLWPLYNKWYDVRLLFEESGITVLWIEPPEGSVDLKKSRLRRVYLRGRHLQPLDKQ